MSNSTTTVYRDMCLWKDWTPGLTTTGGTFVGANPNPIYSVSNLLSLNTTTGTLTVSLPTVPASGNYTGWALRLEFTMECISPNIYPPMAFEPVSMSVSTSSRLCTVYFEDIDWGDFISYGGGNSTVTTKINGAYSAGSFKVNVNTQGVSILDQYNNPLNRKIHILLDLVAY